MMKHWHVTIAALFACQITVSAYAAELESLRGSRHTGFSRLVLDLSDPVTWEIGVDEGARLLVLELSNSRLGYGFRESNLGGLPIRDIEFFRDREAVLSLSMTLDSPHRARAFLLRPFQSRGNRLVIDLYPVAEAIREEPSLDTSDIGSPTERAPGVAGAENATADSDHPPAWEARSTAESVDDLQDSRGWSFEFSGTWEHEWGYATEDEESQKFESLIEPRLDIEFGSGRSLTAIGRLRLDGTGDLGPDENRPDNYSDINGPFANDSHAELTLRELYLDAEWGGAYWRLGKQQVVWGQADGIKVMDVVNPQSLREFIVDEFDDSRIPLWMLNVETPVGDSSSLQAIWIPDTTYHELAEEDTPFFLTSERIVPPSPEGLATRREGFDTPDDPLSDSEAGLRFSTFLGGWDLSLNYLYHYQDFPVLYQAIEMEDGGPVGVVTPEYERNHMLGGTFSNVFGEFTLRGEFVYNTDSYHIANDIESRGIEESKEIGSVIGLDWQVGSDLLISGQWFQSHLLDYRGTIERDETEQSGSVYYQQLFDNETIQFNALYLYSFSHQDSWLQMRLKYMFQSNLELWVGGDFFQGEREGLFGQFKDEDRVLVGMKYGF
jgi:hypothetical protein